MDNKLIYNNKLFVILPAIATTMLLVSTLLSTSTFTIVSTFAHQKKQIKLFRM
jgi:hypothetical protein